MVFVNAIVLFCSVLFIQAGLSKLSSRNAAYYADVFANYNLGALSKTSVLELSMPQCVGLLEFSIGMLVLLTQTKFLALFAGLLLLSFYTAMLIRQLQEGKAGQDCGCSGPAAGLKIDPFLVVRNMLLIVCIIVALFALLPNNDAYEFSIWSFVLSGLTASVFALVYQSFGQLIINKQKIQLLANY